MQGYVLSVLGIVIAGVVIDVVIPSGSISKYIKSIYSIFVVAVLISPIVNFFGGSNKLQLTYEDIQINEKLLTYIYQTKTEQLQDKIEERLNNEGFKNVDIILNFSLVDNQIVYYSCNANLKNLEINQDKQHINKYEFIKKVVEEEVNLLDMEILFDEW